MRIPQLAAVAAAALMGLAGTAFANGVVGGTITAIHPAAHTIALDGARFAVNPTVDLSSWHKGQQVSGYLDNHSSPRTIEWMKAGL